MKKIIYQITIFIISLNIFSACDVYQYVPNSQNVTLFQEKNELSANLSLHNYQFGYSFTKHTAFTTNFFWDIQENGDGLFSFRDEDSNIEIRKFQSYEVEGALGVFTGSRPLNFELFGGAGYGYTDYEHTFQKNSFSPDYNYSVNSNPLKLYLQTNIGFTFFRIFDCAFSTKFIDYKHTNINSSLIGSEINTGKPYDLILESGNEKHLYYIQPALTLRAGLPFMKVQTQFGLNHCINYQNLNSENSYIRFSLFFNIRNKSESKTRKANFRNNTPPATEINYY